MGWTTLLYSVNSININININDSNNNNNINNNNNNKTKCSIFSQAVTVSRADATKKTVSVVFFKDIVGTTTTSVLVFCVICDAQ